MREIVSESLICQMFGTTPEELTGLVAPIEDSRPEHEELFAFILVPADLLATQEQIASLFKVSRQAVAKWKISPIAKILGFDKNTGKLIGPTSDVEYYYLPEVMLYCGLRPQKKQRGD